MMFKHFPSHMRNAAFAPQGDSLLPNNHNKKHIKHIFVHNVKKYLFRHCIFDKKNVSLRKVKFIYY